MSKIPFAPHGYKQDWQQAPRQSGLSWGYFECERERIGSGLVLKVVGVLAILATVLFL